MIGEAVSTDKQLLIFLEMFDSGSGGNINLLKVASVV